MMPFLMLALVLRVPASEPTLQTPSPEPSTEQTQTEQSPPDDSVPPLPSQEQTTETNQSPEQEPTQEPRKSQGKSVQWGTIMQAIAALLVAIFTGLLVYYNRGLLLATKQAAEAARDNAAAFIESQQAQLSVSADDPIPGLRIGENPRITIELLNEGPMAADNCTVETWSEICPFPFNDFTAAAEYQKLDPVTITPHSPRPTAITIEFHQPLTEERLDDLSHFRAILGLRIRISYCDAFGEQRHRSFGFFITPSGLGYLPKYNDSN